MDLLPKPAEEARGQQDLSSDLLMNSMRTRLNLSRSMCGLENVSQKVV